MQIKNFNLDINKLSPKNILVVSLPSIGDALLSSPLIANLKLNFPNAKIDLLVRSGSGLISQYDKNINKIIEFKNKNKVLVPIEQRFVVFMPPHLE